MRIDILSLFPDYFTSPFEASILKRAIEKKLLEIGLVDIRIFSEGKHKKVDDRPYGGGPGMVMMPGPIAKAIGSVKTLRSKVIYLSPQGALLNAAKCRELSLEEHLVVLCGHYEGVDQRVIASAVDEEISIGDYVLTSGCPAALVLVDAVARFIPQVLGHPAAAEEDSFEEGRFDCVHYTRPEVYDGVGVPPVLLSGDHKKIAEWRRRVAEANTARVRPDLKKN